MAFGSGFEHFEVQKMLQRGSYSYTLKQFFLVLILGAPYCSYTVYQHSVLERPAIVICQI
jgi:hypothetical protein